MRSLCQAQQRHMVWRILRAMPLRLLERVMPWVAGGARLVWTHFIPFPPDASVPLSKHSLTSLCTFPCPLCLALVPLWMVTGRLRDDDVREWLSNIRAAAPPHEAPLVELLSQVGRTGWGGGCRGGCCQGAQDGKGSVWRVWVWIRGRSLSLLARLGGGLCKNRPCGVLHWPLSGLLLCHGCSGHAVASSSCRRRMAAAEGRGGVAALTTLPSTAIRPAAPPRSSQACRSSSSHSSSSHSSSRRARLPMAVWRQGCMLSMTPPRSSSSGSSKTRVSSCSKCSYRGFPWSCSMPSSSAFEPMRRRWPREAGAAAALAAASAAPGCHCRSAPTACCCRG